jgi:UPF0755 protein
VTQRERESLVPGPPYEFGTDRSRDLDPGSLLFGEDDFGDDSDADADVARRSSRADRRRSEQALHRTRSRRGRLFVLLTLLIVVGVGVFVVPRVVSYFRVPDYSGAGTGAVTISIPTGASAGDIGDVLKRAGVVKSTKAFTDAASHNSKSDSIQPGRYTLRHHMSGTAAVGALLNPGARITSSDVVVREGVTTFDVAAELVRSCRADKVKLAAALKKPADLGIPVTYKLGTKVPGTAEGFLYPATYTPDSCANPSDVLQRMVSRFIQQDRDTDFARDASKLGLTPYQALIVASIAQAEAKYPTDMPKVVRTILNRLHIAKPLQVDPPSGYAARLQGLDPAKVIYSQIQSPYNTYLHRGLPPTPINNPGADAMAAAVHPAAGNWIYYVNADAAGHLFFTKSDKAFAAAKHTCFVKNWGCGGP